MISCCRGRAPEGTRFFVVKIVIYRDGCWLIKLSTDVLVSISIQMQFQKCLKKYLNPISTTESRLHSFLFHSNTWTKQIKTIILLVYLVYIRLYSNHLINSRFLLVISHYTNPWKQHFSWYPMKTNEQPHGNHHFWPGSFTPSPTSVAP